MRATGHMARQAWLGVVFTGILMGQARSPVAPTPESVQATVREAYEKFKGDATGKNADYIPFLAKVPSNLFGIVGITTDGRTFTVGDIDYAFSIQSISKVFTLALAMEELGPEEVFKKIGSEPTGRPFNSVSAVEDLPGRTGNPFVNAGAIATTSLIKGASAAEKWNKILSFYSRVAGSKLELIDEVYKSEAATNQHNRGIAVLLESYERMYSDPLEATDIYTKQCSVGVTAKQLAMMGATLADHGRNPVSGQQVIKRENVPHILAVMTMAGLYDGSGGWAWNVGLPAKSGVGGGLLAIVPGKGAIVGFAPPLDQAGNSVKAQKAIAYIADKLGLNLFSPRSVGLN
ncbi:MAG TPA: glutaminase A [Candidatus Acidoferrales bacterium]|nr:glutaminase A [Candidatus Acidoferrales bacterium]